MQGVLQRAQRLVVQVGDADEFEAREGGERGGGSRSASSASVWAPELPADWRAQLSAAR